jgi:hypothetical protein
VICSANHTFFNDEFRLFRFEKMRNVISASRVMIASQVMSAFGTLAELIS